MSNTNTWQAIASRKKKQQEERIPKAWHLDSTPASDNLLAIPRTCGILSNDEIGITEDHDATALVEALAAGKLQSVDVVTAFCKRAAIAQQLTSCLTEIFFDAAIAHAHSLDEHLARTGKPKGPLHGLPISLKDMFHIKGFDASLGIASLCFKESTSNSPLVDLLLEAGAVVYCKTNVPQTLMALDSHNNIFGRTLNPLNTRLTAGGSSGGESALLALRGSLLGIGSDVGGSIRIPAMCCGLYGIKPSHGRIPYTSLESAARPGFDALGIRTSAGPIAHSVRDCELLLRVVADAEPWARDPEVVAQDWAAQMPLAMSRSGPAHVTIGVVRTDGVTTPLPPIARFMDEVAARLGSVAHIDVVELDITSLLSQCQSLVNGIFGIEGGNHMFDMLEATSEPLSPWLQPRIIRRPQASLDRVRELFARRSAMQTEFLKIWTEGGGYWAKSGSGGGSQSRRLDAIICPVAPHPVPEIDRWNTASYTSSFTLLDYPAATLPVRRMGPADLKDEMGGQPTGSWDKANRKLWIEVDRKVYLGSPLCLQIVGQKLQDRKVVEIMAVLDEALRGLNSRSGEVAKL